MLLAYFRVPTELPSRFNLLANPAAFTHCEDPRVDLDVNNLVRNEDEGSVSIELKRPEDTEGVPLRYIFRSIVKHEFNVVKDEDDPWLPGRIKKLEDRGWTRKP